MAEEVLTPAIVDLGKLVRGDTFRTVTVGPILIDDATPESELTGVELSFFPANRPFAKHGRSSRLPTVKFGTAGTNSTYPITISDAANWMFTIDLVADFDALPCGKWEGRLKTTDAAGVGTTLYTMTLEIL